jgi:hypothetical protein
MTELEVLRLERDTARRHVEMLVKILVGINQLLYPPVMRMPDVMMRFHLETKDVNVYMQELSDRIRAIPDEIQAAEAQTRL